MKNVMLMIGFMFSMMSMTANNTQSTREISHHNEDPLSFTERGIQFYVFLDGEFDFNTSTSANYDTFYRQKQSRRRDRANNCGTPSGIRIERDHMGRVRRIGNVFMNYDRFGRVKRIGSVYMNYRRGYLTQIGGLCIRYNGFFEIVNLFGYIKPNHCNHGHYCGCSGGGHTYYGSNNHGNTYYRNTRGSIGHSSNTYYRKNRTNRSTNRTRRR